MKKIKYKHKFSLRVGEVAHVNGIPCEYLGMGNFGTNTYPGKPQLIDDKDHNQEVNKIEENRNNRESNAR